MANFRLYWIYSDCLDKSFLSRNQKIKLHFCFEKLDARDAPKTLALFVFVHFSAVLYFKVFGMLIVEAV